MGDLRKAFSSEVSDRIVLNHPGVPQVPILGPENQMPRPRELHRNPETGLPARDSESDIEANSEFGVERVEAEGWSW